MSADLIAAVNAALATVIDPEIHRPITELDMVDAVSVDDAGVASLTVLLTITGCPMANTIEADVRAKVSAVPGVSSVDLTMSSMSADQRAALKRKLRGGQDEREIPFAKADSRTQVLLIASGKGGVGKSSTTVNLAMGLVAQGRSVGVLDADIYGHSIPQMLGLVGSNPTMVEGMIMPVPSMGLKVISIGMLKESRDQVIAWRGPILDRALQQFLADVYWGDLDFLLVDLPPGTGDVALSLGQKLPNAEVIVVTTPQQASAEVAERAGTMASMVNQKVLGVVENMAYLEVVCPHCDQSHRVDVFGSGGGAEVASTLTTRLGYEVPLLAEVPMDPSVSASGDEGVPLVSSDPSRPAAAAILALAELLSSRKPRLAGKQLGLTPVG
ncbi:Mrp/NBP35 family ATP-binding protein [Propionicimonas sp.]|uniref:Mrp/NBP35 family ATP-binding protein n=1 Tax=Propionicimonas sp. TaxID=1955623 RepID=UPI0017A3BD6A|nr:Mrp/NBP35 family ATP-binding protein [Propionicimonas sp.]MBU3977943.1 Mrp/NBP35 family ATP-binding protein [Actinomycetota bacterium]MBA3021834.1 Mrp/NBP35 family ATP-binding protein [Propionicimonas sp.]MBU3985387.1 Mrp/NBP35 family ATP-binding protein [Actinomycetota bacterium]MBU4007482.1 Mrp/NBP35 family ATP-binding protein [Actinomycetota bacterium]MBU4066624.1 Mrp/NBP35 family ATP-binding protein [Actinomycetota bacterium]